MVIKPMRFLWAGLMLCLCLSGKAQDHPSGDSPCNLEITTSTSEGGEVTVCYSSLYQVGHIYFSCTASAGGYIASSEGGRTNCMTLTCCPESAPLLLTWRADRHPCHQVVDVSCCVGTDTDGDGVCDEEDCLPDDASVNYGPGDNCDDGDPATFGDRYDENCNCVGDPDEGCLTGDSDGDGICDEEDCAPDDASSTHMPGDYCNDGDPLTVNDRYDDNCVCTGDPFPCGDVWPDDGCPLTTEVVNADCTVTYLPPDVDDDCEGTIDYFDFANCRIVNEPILCDDGNPDTVDYYNEDCDCIGYDPCELRVVEWDKVFELLDNH